MTEKVEYSIVSKSGDIEVRHYPKMILASVSGVSDEEAFGLLFDYISGNNVSSESIAMTAPVISGGGRSEKLPMTAPVVSSSGSFSFVMPLGRDVDSLPKPRNEGIAIDEVSERTIATLRFRGKTKPQQVMVREAQLLKELKRKGISAIGEPFLMRYSPPFVPGFLRRNEVGLEVNIQD